MTKPVAMGSTHTLWQYHSRSDRHSKVACWGILFDLLKTCPLLAEHVAAQKVGFGINHEMRDFKVNRKKNLDLVLCTPGPEKKKASNLTFRSLIDKWEILLSAEERMALDAIPDMHEQAVGVVHAALEAKACMTAHSKARPRLYDELNSSHLTIHGSTDMAIAIGYVLINIAETFKSPSMPTVTKHKQAGDTIRVIEKIKELPRRTTTGQDGFDALAIVIIDCKNDGISEVKITTSPPAPPAGDIFHYDSMIKRVAQLYESRFPRV